MIKPIDPEQVIRYVLKAERNKPDQKATVFHVKPMTFRKSLAAGSNMRFTRDGQVELSDLIQMRERLFTENVCKIENWMWPGSNECIDLEAKEDIVRAFTMLSVEDGVELTAAIQDLSMLEAGEIKN